MTALPMPDVAGVAAAVYCDCFECECTRVVEGDDDLCRECESGNHVADENDTEDGGES